jgi:hypothetical protein
LCSVSVDTLYFAFLFFCFVLVILLSFILPAVYCFLCLIRWSVKVKGIILQYIEHQSFCKNDDGLTVPAHKMASTICFYYYKFPRLWNDETPIKVMLSRSLYLKAVKGAVSRHWYFFEGLNILISTFCVCPDDFKIFQKLFTTLSNYKLFICFFEITY